MNEVSVWFVLDVIIKRLWIILIVAALLATGTYIYNSNFVDPIYSAESSVIASNGGIISDANVSGTTSKIGSSDIASSLNITETYVDILKTYGFYETVANEPEIARMGYSASAIRSMTTIQRRSDMSLFIDIIIKCGNQRDAVVIANCVAVLATDYIHSMLNNAYVVPADKCQTARLVAPLTVRNSITMGVLGALAVIALFVIIAVTDNTIKGEEDIVKRYNVAVLGVVPDFEAKKAKRR
jgi:capsular polysaccharide biosynthesis protein